jgi:hypothetical protein
MQLKTFRARLSKNPQLSIAQKTTKTQIPDIMFIWIRKLGDLHLQKTTGKTISES